MTYAIDIGPAHAGDEDDAARDAGGAHGARGRLGGEEGAGDVDVEDAAEGGGRVGEGVDALAQAGAGEEAADGVARGGGQGGEDGGQGGVRCHVAGVVGQDAGVGCCGGEQVGWGGAGVSLGWGWC